MKVLITGGSGFIGQHLCASLVERGYKVVIADLMAPRQQTSGVDFVKIDLVRDEIPLSLVSEVDAIIHLAGVNLFTRWNEPIKQAIYQSRVESSRRLVAAIGKAEPRPKVLISASAVGYYGHRGEEELFESSLPGNDFLAKVCVDWEEAARYAQNFGLRIAQIRTAPVIGRGGFLSKMLWLYKLGLGGIIGSGEQWFPWIHIKDIVGIYIFALEQPQLQGPINACSPELVRSQVFFKALGKALHRPVLFSFPVFAVKLFFGELADFISASQKVIPKKLLTSGYKFSFPQLKHALSDVVGS